jgi:hypothetical protein
MLQRGLTRECDEKGTTQYLLVSSEEVQELHVGKELALCGLVLDETLHYRLDVIITNGEQEVELLELLQIEFPSTSSSSFEATIDLLRGEVGVEMVEKTGNLLSAERVVSVLISTLPVLLESGLRKTRRNDLGTGEKVLETTSPDLEVRKAGSDEVDVLVVPTVNNGESHSFLLIQLLLVCNLSELRGLETNSQFTDVVDLDSMSEWFASSPSESGFIAGKLEETDLWRGFPNNGSLNLLELRSKLHGTHTFLV